MWPGTLTNYEQNQLRCKQKPKEALPKNTSNVSCKSESKYAKI